MWLDRRERIHAPALEGPWLNSRPLATADLRGRVVLVDFWDYTCVNCLRTLPYLAAWDERYRDAGLVIVGVHSPEFHFARTAENVARAVRALQVRYSVVLDNEYRNWHAFANRCWPAKYLIDAKGYIRFVHLGEGAYAETEQALQTLLGEMQSATGTTAGPASGQPMPPVIDPLRPDDLPGAKCYPVTPEIYLGYVRGKLSNPDGYAEGEVAEYQAPPSAALELGRPALDGPWFAGREALVACPLPGRESRLMLRYQAAEVNLVLSPPEEASPETEGAQAGGRLAPVAAWLEILQDGEPVASEDLGQDVAEAGGSTGTSIDGPRMYRLVKNRAFGERVLELRTGSPRLEFYAFTFVSCIIDNENE